MPLYEYRCTQCNHTFEVSHHVGGLAGACPVCGGPTKRIFSSIGLIFKGSGFYTTDNRKSPSSDGSARDSGKTAEGAAKTEQKNEPKNKPKSEPKSDPKSEQKS